MSKAGRSRRLTLLIVAALIGVGVGALFAFTGLGDRLEAGTIDKRFDVRGRQAPNPDVVLVGIDGRAVATDSWPINRGRYATVIKQLDRAGVRAIALDVQITEASEDAKADNALYTAVRDSSRPVIMGTTEVDKSGKTAIFGGGQPLVDSRAIPANTLFKADGDGVLRRMPLPIRGLDSLANLAASKQLGHTVSTPAGKAAYIDYPGSSGTVPTISFVDVEAGKFSAAAVRGKVVVIGASGSLATTLQDIKAVSTASAMAGPEVQADAIATALAGFPLRAAPDWVLWLAMIVAAALVPLVASRFGALLGLVAAFLASLLYLVLAQLAFDAGHVVDVVPPVAAALAAGVASAVLVHGARPAWADRALDRISPARGQNSRSRRLRATLLLTAALIAVLVPLVLEAGGVLKRTEVGTIDTRFSVRGSQGPPPDVVLVAFDDVTFSDLKQQWPINRKYHARAIRVLKAAGAKVIAYDVQFTEPSDSVAADNALYDAVQKAGNVVLSTTEVGADGTTSVFGGGEALKQSRATPASTIYAADPDGRLRRMNFSQNGLATFPMAAARLFEGKPVTHPPGDTAYVDFAGGTNTVTTISFSQVVRQDFNPATVRGKVVVVGSTATSLQDYHRTATSGDALMPGPEVQSNAIQTAIDGFPLRPAPWWLNALFVLVLGALAPLTALRRRMTIAIGGGVLVLAAFVVGAQIAFNHGTIYTVTYPIIAAVVGLLSTGAIHGVTVAFEREQTRDAFARFVPESVVDQVLADAEGLRLGGVRGEATVMFSDLRGFTSFSETLEPERVIDSLNRYLTLMSEAILDHGGTLVAYMGDGIMAVFGAPLKQDDHADRALEAARDMLARMEDFNDFLRGEHLHDGFKMGIGLNSGPVMSGNVGSERRLEYTALGDTTNTAARLEGMTKGTPHQLYISDTTKQLLQRAGDDLVQVGEAEVRGRKAKVLLWSVRDAPPAPAPAPEPTAPIEA